MDLIFKQFQDRFPLLTHLLLEERERRSAPEELSAYLGIFLSVFSNMPTSPVCFVLPRRGELARLSVVLYVMCQLIRKEKQLTQSYAERSFSIGDLVCVHPGREVFRYGGYNAAHPDLIWLETVNDRNNGDRERWGVPAADVVNRLEKTTRTRPIGRLNSPILSPRPTPLDLLLGTSFFGNYSFVTNEVLILDSVSGFTDFAETYGFLSRTNTSNTHSLKTLIPFGRLIVPPDPAHPGRLRKRAENGGIGEPIIAVTRSSDLLADFCIDAPARSQLVVVNGLDHIRHIQAYDDIAQTQHLVAFTDHDDEEMIEILGRRGCRFWPLSGRELASWTTVATSGGMLGSVKRWAENHDTFSVDDVPCEDMLLDGVWHKLDKLGATTARDNDDPILSRLIGRIWGLFLNAIGAWEIPTSDERNDAVRAIETFKQDVRHHRTWITPENLQMMTEIADNLASCYAPGSGLGATKRMALLNVVWQSIREGNKLAILVRGEVTVGECHRWLAGQNLAPPVMVFSPRTLPSGDTFDRVICVSWFGREVMKQVIAKLTAPRVTVIGYPCERHWLQQCQPRFKYRIPASVLTRDEKSTLLADTEQPSLEWPKDEIQIPTRTAPTDETDVWDFERRLRVGRIGLAAKPTEATETLPARYVRFSGECYAFLTETHKLPVATDLVSGRAHAGQTLPERTLGDIKPGDFIVFPESGGRELIQELADRLVGQTAGQLRSVAHIWKDALHASGLTPEEFLQQAKELKRPRHLSTIRNWFADDSQIGPREKDDLLLIEIVTRDKTLEREADAVWSAIEQIRSAHLSAGMRLRDTLRQRLPKVIGQVEENGTKVVLDELGSAWLVRVESIETTPEPRGRAEVDRLLFDKFNADLSALLRDLG